MRHANSLSRSSIRVLAGVCLVCLLGLFSGSATAQGASKTAPPNRDEALLKACEQSQACSSHLSRANQLYDKDSYAAALDEYQAAYILQPYPLLLYNMAAST